MNKPKLIVITLAVFMASLGVYFAQRYIDHAIQTQANQLKKPGAAAPKPQAVLVGLKRPVQQGTRITEDMIAKLYVDADLVEGQDYTPWSDHQQIINQILLVTLPPASALRYSDLSDQQYQVFSDLLEPGERAITVNADIFNSFSGFLQPKDRVDIMLVSHKPSGDTLSLFQNIEIIATDNHYMPGLALERLPHVDEIKTITFRLTAEQAQMLAMAQTQGELVLLLRNQHEQQSSKPQRLTHTLLFPTSAPVEIIIGGQS